MTGDLGPLVEALRSRSRALDESARFPVENLSALGEARLMGLLVPQRFGGRGADLATFAHTATTLAEGCLPTAMVWAMHGQQVSVLAELADRPAAAETLRRIVSDGWFVASVTSETGGGGSLFSAGAPVEGQGKLRAFRRSAPSVTGGIEADAWLMTMRRSPDAAPNEVVFLLAHRDQVSVTPTRPWATLGMRATASRGIDVEGSVPEDQVLADAGTTHRLLIDTFVPTGHIGWSACWLGAARGALREAIGVFRDPATRAGFPVSSDLFAERLAAIRLRLDTVDALLWQTIADYQRLRTTGGAVGSTGFQLRINDLKIHAAEACFDAVSRLQELCGLRHGYRSDAATSIERTFRDLASARLMYPNDRLLVTNGRLALLDRQVRLGSAGAPEGEG